MVGDPHQQIYGFRDAINAMELIQTTRTFYLTQVFVSRNSTTTVVFIFLCCLSYVYDDSYSDQFAVGARFAMCYY